MKILNNIFETQIFLQEKKNQESITQVNIIYQNMGCFKK